MHHVLPARFIGWLMLVTIGVSAIVLLHKDPEHAKPERRERPDAGVVIGIPTWSEVNPETTYGLTIAMEHEMHVAIEQERHAKEQAYAVAIETALEAQRQARPKLAPRVGSTSAALSTTNVGSDDDFGRLAQCECGGNPGCNTGNGYYGTFQFTLSTWRSVGGEGYPHEHSYEEQLLRAQVLQARSGWGPWPGCAAKLGLR